MTFAEEGDGMTEVYYVNLEVMIPWTASTKTWKFRGYLQAKENRLSGGVHWKSFIGTYSFQTRQGEGVFVRRLGSLRDINLSEPADYNRVDSF